MIPHPRQQASVALVEGGEAEGLGGGGADDFPDVDAHPVGGDLELVDQADVDGALAASVFHKGIIQISDLKQFLLAAKVEIRP